MVHKKHSADFKREALKLAVTSGLPRVTVAADQEIGKSNLGKWISRTGSSREAAAERQQRDLGRH